MGHISTVKVAGLLVVVGLMFGGITIADERNNATDATKAANNK